MSTKSRGRTESIRAGRLRSLGSSPGARPSAWCGPWPCPWVQKSPHWGLWGLAQHPRRRCCSEMSTPRRTSPLLSGVSQAPPSGPMETHGTHRADRAGAESWWGQSPPAGSRQAGGRAETQPRIKDEIGGDRKTEAGCIRERGVRLGGDTGAPMSHVEQGHHRALGPDNQAGVLCTKSPFQKLLTTHSSAHSRDVLSRVLMTGAVTAIFRGLSGTTLC